jgi:hypothetical protein
MTLTLSRGPGGLYYEVTAEDGRSQTVQTDWDYPGLASSFGWSTQRVQTCPECGIVTAETIYSRGWPVEFLCPKCDAVRVNQCPHQTTDGTCDCECGAVTATDFITSAADWLDAKDGETVDDPGYFVDA